MDSNVILFLDFESGSKNKYKTQPTQLACVALDVRTGDVIPGSEFCSYMKPLFTPEECKKAGVDEIQQEALDITNITLAQLEAAPDTKTVWNNFVEYAGRYNPGKGQWSAPIMGGFNIENFDKEIIRRLAGVKPYNFGPFDKEYQECTLFHPFKRIDIMRDLIMWMAPKKEVRSVSMDAMREYFGMSKEKAHDALVDVKQGAAILSKFLKLYNFFSPKVKFKDCFKGHPEFGA